MISSVLSISFAVVVRVTSSYSFLASGSTEYVTSLVLLLGSPGVPSLVPVEDA